MSIPVKKLLLTSVFTAIIFTGLIGLLIKVNAPSIPNFPRIVADTLTSIIVVAIIDIFTLKYILRKFPKWSAGKTSLLRYFATYVLAFIYTFIIELLISFFFEPEKLAHMQTLQGLGEQLFGAVIITALIFITHNQVLVRQRRIDAELALSHTRAANVEATNLVLKQQIQPHFLFNALNIMNSLYKRDYNTGHTYMLHLASFLRATVSSTKQNVLTIAEEIKMCNDYVAMQKIRFKDALNFTINVDQEHLKGFVPSFSLQPLIENAIKHNALTNENPLLINLYTEDGYLFVKNNLSAIEVPPASTGQGLANLIKRYELLSGDEVKIEKDNTHFTIRLKILSDEHYHN